MPLSNATETAAIIKAHYAAYTAADVPGILATLAADVTIGPLIGGTNWISGRAAAEGMYATHVKRWPMALTDELGSMQVGGRVIKREHSRPADPADITADVMGIYTVNDGLISRLDMVRDGPGTEAALAAAEAQLVAYNAQDLEAHVACFAPDVTVANLHEAPNLTGREAYRERMGGVFSQFPHNRVELLGRLALGTIVCDHELVLRGPYIEPFEVIAIYRVEDGLIREVRFIR